MANKCGVKNKHDTRRTFGVAVSAAVAGTLAAAAMAGATPQLSPGVYQATVRAASPPVLNGLWRLTLKRSAFEVTKNGRPAVTGRIRIAGDLVTFHDLAGPFRCPGPQATGTYRWKLAGSVLRLIPRVESCPGRALVLARAFRKIG